MRLLVLALYGCLFWGASVSAETQKVNLETLIKHFNSVVFVHEHGKKGQKETALFKWKGPIIYSPSGTLTRKQVNEFFKLMKRIRLLTKLDMRMAKKGDKANLIINFLPQKELAKKLKKGINCYGNIGGNSKAHTLLSGKAYIPSDRPEKTLHCLVEETVQLFGLKNDSDEIKNSIFNEKSKRNSLSVSDQILLKALYDRRLRPGMTKEQAQPVLRVVLKEILEKASKKKK